MSYEVLAINPGSTSTKIAWFDDGSERWSETVRHDADRIASFSKTADQYLFRMETIEKAVEAKGSSLDDLSCVVGRGGIIDPIPGGTYEVDEALLERLRSGKPWDHASNLGGILADAIASSRGIPAFIVDPVSVDELDDLARLSGLPELPRIPLNHALNVKATVRRAAKDLGVDWQSSKYVVVHMGGGMTICAHSDGKLIDFNSGNDFGPFSPERAGGMPAGDLVGLCFGGKIPMSDLKKRLAGKGGVFAYLGTSDMREVSERAGSGDREAELVRNSMSFQIAGAIGSMAAALSGDVSAILFTGGVAYDSEFVASVQRRVQWVAPCLVYPGEGEMEALAEGALRVLKDEEKARSYADTVKGVL
ncbi:MULTISPECIES: butyrate kinase [Dethiosulfovibrio]|uniref:Probable butyrate kinase n=2 Tax=Dethiosulfovibrio TaxID=47054 RepID=A0ABS9ET14_9BACT|nr:MULTISPECIES: butyrate kinase [Dethiosulfovibrio]MCF4114339.1 butyrate kinase [Dethiosulfovibrio russensis]MCF4143000.1 butyrate kinase [Dethiosulfovibrio marinus]MCF4145097.1 butyrate kinase [Dethiosulfovibrio acidaminovorans]